MVYIDSEILLLLSHFSCVRLCATPKTAAHQAPPSLGFSRQEHWSGLPFPSPMHESESEVTQLYPTLSDPIDCSYSAIKKWDFAFAATWMEFRGCYAKWNVRQRNKNTVWSNLFVESKKIQQTSDYNKKKQTHMYREQPSGYRWGEGRELKGKNYCV